MKKPTVKNSKGEIGRVRIVENFLPSPDRLVLREENVRQSEITVLYDSQSILKRISYILDSPAKSDERICMVAYIGEDWRRFIRWPKRLQVICNPDPAATSAVAVAELEQEGAEVFFSDKLHMKVYWSRLRGCVICSANLSRNAFGAKGLKEAGIYVPPKLVDIRKLQKYSQPKRVTPAQLAQLRRDEILRETALAREGIREHKATFSFADWHRLPEYMRTPWKLGCWDDTAEPAKEACEKVRADFGLPRPADWLCVSRNKVQVKDWLLMFELVGRTLKGRPTWLLVDYVVSLTKQDEDWTRQYPLQAVQARSRKHNPRPPFQLDARFVGALRKACKDRSRSINSTNLRPSTRLIDFLASNSKSR